MKQLFIAIFVLIIFTSIACAQEDFVVMREKIQDLELTDLQQNRLIKPYLGKTVLWQGWVEDVKEKGNGFVCCVDMDKPDIIFSVYDFEIEVSEDLALKLRKDQVVYVTGTIKSIDTTLGFNVKLTNPKLTTQKPRKQ